jgi:hypothetical protein
MTRMVRLPCMLLFTAWLAGCAARPVAPDLGNARRWLRTELYFATGFLDQPEKISRGEWQTFLDGTVTPLFPDGLTVAEAFGQWRSKGRSVPEKLVSKILIILHPDDAVNRAKIERIRESWTARYHHESVLRASGPVEVAF